MFFDLVLGCFGPLGPLGFERAQHRQTLRPSRSRDPQQSPASCGGAFDQPWSPKVDQIENTSSQWLPGHRALNCTIESFDDPLAIGHQIEKRNLYNTCRPCKVAQRDLTTPRTRAEHCTSLEGCKASWIWRATDLSPGSVNAHPRQGQLRQPGPLPLPPPTEQAGAALSAGIPDYFREDPCAICCQVGEERPRIGAGLHESCGATRPGQFSCRCWRFLWSLFRPCSGIRQEISMWCPAVGISG